MLSFFLSGKLPEDQTFNEFYENLLKRITSKNINHEQMQFQLLIITESLDGSSKSIQINNSNEIKFDYFLPISNTNLSKMIKTDGENIFVYLLSRDSDYSVTCTFKQLNNKWKLTQITN